MKLKIDIEKSIVNGKICPKSWFSYYSDWLMYGFFGVFFIFCIIMNTIHSSNENATITITIAIFWVSIVFFVFALTFFTVDKMKRLREFVINDKAKTIAFILSLTADSDWKIQKQEDEIIIFQINPSFCNERQVTFIIRNRNLYVNVMSFGRDITSPIYYFSDKDVLKSIIDKLKENKIVQVDFS